MNPVSGKALVICFVCFIGIVLAKQLGKVSRDDSMTVLDEPVTKMPRDMIRSPDPVKILDSFSKGDSGTVTSDFRSSCGRYLEVCCRKIAETIAQNRKVLTEDLCADRAISDECECEVRTDPIVIEIPKA